MPADITNTVTLASSRKPPILTLVVLAAVSPLAMNLFVPSMTSIGNELEAPYTTIQLGLSLYLVLTAVLQLFVGPLSDRFGRKPVLNVSLIVFLIGTALCVFAPNVTLFLIGRIVQTTSAAGMVLSRAIIRDVYPREKSASMIGYVVMGMAVAPMIGPAIGGYVDGVAGWRMSFALLGAFGVAALLATLFTLPETNTSQGQTFGHQMETWKSLLSLRIFWLYALVGGLTSSVFFSFLGGGPAVSTVYLGQSPFQYGLYFSMCAIGYAAGNFISGRFSEARGIENMMRDGAFVSVTGPVISLALFYFGFDHPMALFAPLTLVGVGNGMTLPNATAAGISLKPEAAGAASGLLGALQIALGAVGSVLGAMAAGEEGSPIGLTGFMTAAAILSVAVTIYTIRQPVPKPETVFD